MKVLIPFVYCATLIPARCRKSREVYLADEVEVEIPDLCEAELAGRLVKTEFDGPDTVTDYWFCDGDLWTEHCTYDGRGTWTPISLSDWMENLKKPASSRNPAGSHTLAAMRRAQERFATLPTQKTLADVHPYREYLSDTRAQEVTQIRAALSRFGIFKDSVLEKASEPVFYAQTFGMGANHGGTSLFVGSSAKARCSTAPRAIFNVKEKEKAVKFAETVALERGDTESVPNRGLSDFQVFIPEAFTFNPFSKDALDAGEISLAEYLEHNAAEPGRMSALIDDTVRSVIPQIKAAPLSEQIDWLRAQGVKPEEITRHFDA